MPPLPQLRRTLLTALRADIRTAPTALRALSRACYHLFDRAQVPLAVGCRSMYSLVATVPLGLAVSTPTAKPTFSYKAYNDAMTYKKLGSSDLLVSSCCMGTMTWGNQNTDADATLQLNEAWDNRGINFLDTAECCAPRSESEAKTQQPPRHQRKRVSAHVDRHALPPPQIPCPLPRRSRALLTARSPSG